MVSTAWCIVVFLDELCFSGALNIAASFFVQSLCVDFLNDESPFITLKESYTLNCVSIATWLFNYYRLKMYFTKTYLKLFCFSETL